MDLGPRYDTNTIIMSVTHYAFSKDYSASSTVTLLVETRQYNPAYLVVHQIPSTFTCKLYWQLWDFCAAQTFCALINLGMLQR